MKRAIGLIFAAAAIIVAVLSVRGNLPFMPIYGSSMEPTLTSGSLLMIDPIDPQDIKVGDIIVYDVPSMVREYYNYPPTVSHRVIEIMTTPALGFRTKGDNTGEDPFTISPNSIRGTVGNQIPYLGLPLLFFQSTQGVIFAIIALILLAIFLYGVELRRGGNWLHRGVFAPVINEEKRANRILSRQIEATEKKMDSTEQALEKFSLAVAEYAKHLASHTSAIQGLSDASQELKKGAAEQNRVLAAIIENVAKSGVVQEPIIIQEARPAPRVEKKEKTVEKPFHGALLKAVPGCARKHPPTPEEIVGQSH
ncbi:MAG: signal peptidase I [Dehalococcoidales bacterium]|nr:signal peptidase I [Dehalococcoidales bacterium]